MTRIKFTKPARRDLDDIYSYIARDSASMADRVVRRIERLCLVLELAPHSGHPTEVLGSRKFIVPHVPYKVIYRFREDEELVEILHIYHTSRNLP